MIVVVLVFVWLLLGFLAAGIIMPEYATYNRYRWPRYAYRECLGIGAFVFITGPFGLLTSLFITGFAKYGIHYTEHALREVCRRSQEE